MSKLLAIVLAALVIVAMPLSGGAAAKTTDIFQLAHQHVRVTTDGLFAIDTAGVSRPDSARLHGVFDSLNAKLAAVDRAQRPTLESQTKSRTLATSGGKMAALAAYTFCGYIPRWAFEVYAWTVIVVGGVTSTVGLFVSGTIIGLPAGAVLSAAGIWIGLTGGAMLWAVDTYMPVWGVYVCV